MASTSRATVDELKNVLKESLEARGVMGQLQARVRAEIFKSMQDPLEEKPRLNHENMLINELIREYLEFNKYNHTHTVLLAETGQPRTPLSRDFLARELNVREDPDTASVPLLYGILNHFTSRRQDTLPAARPADIPSSSALYRPHSSPPLSSRSRSPVRTEQEPFSRERGSHMEYVREGMEGQPLVYQGGRR
ncbi:centrosomal protein 20-like [Branchiostoma floridae]|uniref:Centrosomal protein 20 n=2 Tax=Branchiostoma floridae TaxID=7739 RepID=A0A9J7M675_BRAFL|nr:centrosomal protein 20-like [Branchiostoma floridae]